MTNVCRSTFSWWKRAYIIIYVRNAGRFYEGVCKRIIDETTWTHYSRNIISTQLHSTSLHSGQHVSHRICNWVREDIWGGQPKVERLFHLNTAKIRRCNRWIMGSTKTLEMPSRWEKQGRNYQKIAMENQPWVCERNSTGYERYNRI